MRQNLVVAEFSAAAVQVAKPSSASLRIWTFRREAAPPETRDPSHWKLELVLATFSHLTTPETLTPPAFRNLGEGGNHEPLTRYISTQAALA